MPMIVVLPNGRALKDLTARAPNTKPHVWRIIPDGGHDFRGWKSDLYHFAQLLFRSASVLRGRPNHPLLSDVVLPIET